MPKQLPKVYFGLHMAEGVAEYAEPNRDPYRILILENTLKTMDATYAGKPVYVQHVEEVDLETLQEDADGYVMESFFNTCDGKHWVKFIAVSDKAHEAIRRGWKLSNSYVPKSFSDPGQSLWHGVQYAKEITDGEYEHLAIVDNPRYEESVIMTPEEFKQYNNDKKLELERLKNSKNEKEKKEMAPKLSWFKKAKVENSIDLEMSVVLPKSGKEITVEKMVSLADEALAKKENSLADPHDKVKMHDGNMCNVGELVKKHKALYDELEGMKAKKDDASEEESDVEAEDEAVEVEGDDAAVDNDDASEADDEGAIEADKDNDSDDDEDDSMDNGDDDEDAKKKALELAEHEEKEIEAAKKKKNAADLELKKLIAKKAGDKKSNVADIKKAAAKKAADKVKADKLRNAHLNFEPEETATVELMQDQVARGKTRYGSN